MPQMNSPRLLLMCAALLAPLPAAALRLADAERLMLANDPALTAARIELRGSQGDLVAAGRRPVAELALGTSKYSRIEGLGPGRLHDKRLDSTAGVGWTWERGGKRRLRLQQAGALLDAAALDLADAGRLQRLALREAYFGLKAAQETLAVAEADRAQSAEAMAAIAHQVRVGAVAAIERDRLQVEDLKLASAQRAAMLDLLDAQQALALLLGEGIDPQQLQAEDPWPQPQAWSEADTAAVLERRADLRAAAQRVQAADSGRALARSLRRRDIGLGVEAEREPTDVAGVTWGVSISVPLHGPGHYRGEIVRAEADYDLAALEQRVAVDAATRELQRLRQALHQADARLRDYEGALAPAAQAAREGMELAYRRGAASLTDLLDARRAAREADLDLIEARATHALALAQWQAATRTTDTADESVR